MFNPVLISALAAMLAAQILKVPFDYLANRRINWRVMNNAGGMPSSHSALLVAATLSIGLFEGFGSALFGLAVAITMVVLYDAAGVRREAGMHAQRINLIFQEVLQGHPITDARLKEVLGHSPFEVLVGTILGLITALIVWGLY